MSKTFTNQWFEDVGGPKTFKSVLGKFAGKPVWGLEIGSYEGRSACWLMDNILTHYNSFLDCVDDFKSSPEHGRIPDVRVRFLQNVEQYQRLTHLENITEIVGPYSFAYIDGSHRASDVMLHACMAWAYLTRGGVLIFDDYEWEGGDTMLDRPKVAIDSFLLLFARAIKVLHKGYQVAVEKLV